MRLITSFELATRNKIELTVIFQKVSGELNRADGKPDDKRIAMASLDNILRAIRARTEFKP